MPPTKIVYNNEVISPIHLTIFFTNIGSSIENKIPQSKKALSAFLGDHNTKSVFITPYDSNEILLLLSKMRSSKASGPNSISTNLLIEFRGFLVQPLVSIIIYPWSVLFTRKVMRQNVKIIDQFHFSPI